MAKLRIQEDQDDIYDEELLDWKQQHTTTMAGASRGQARGPLLWDLGVLETLLIIVCGVCLLLLVLSFVYFYIMHKLGRFSDNPTYKRRMYYAMSTTSSNQNPAQCFNVFKRERPNTLSLTGGASTPSAVIVPVPTMDAAVGDDRIMNGGRKVKAAKGKLKSESMSKYRISASSNAVGPMVAPREKHAKKQYGKQSSSKRMAEEEASSDESGVYVTPPQDTLESTARPFRSANKEKIPASKRRAQKK